MIHFVTLNLAAQVHAQALGFTKQLYIYCWGETKDEAERVAVAFCAFRGLQLGEVQSCRPAQKADLHSYTFLEQIYGAPLDLIEQALKLKGYPAEIEQEALDAARKNNEGIKRHLSEASSSTHA